MATTLASLTAYVTIGGQVISGSGVLPAPDGFCATYTKITNWWEPPATTGAVTQRSGQHGAYTNDAFFTERNIVVEGEFFAPNRAILIKGIERFIASIPVNELAPFVVYEKDIGLMHAMVRQGGQHVVDWAGKSDPSSDGLTASFSIQLVAPNPRRLSGDGSTRSKVLETVPGGAGSITVTNDGYGITPPMTITITDCTDPTLTVNGKSVTWTTAQTLVIDFDSRTVRAGGVLARSIQSAPLQRLNGSVDTISFSAAAYGAGAKMKIETEDSYL